MYIYIICLWSLNHTQMYIISIYIYTHSRMAVICHWAVKITVVAPQLEPHQAGSSLWL